MKVNKIENETIDLINKINAELKKIRAINKEKYAYHNNYINMLKNDIITEYFIPEYMKLESFNKIEQKFKLLNQFIEKNNINEKNIKNINNKAVKHSDLISLIKHIYKQLNNMTRIVFGVNPSYFKTPKIYPGGYAIGYWIIPNLEKKFDKKTYLTYFGNPDSLLEDIKTTTITNLKKFETIIISERNLIQRVRIFFETIHKFGKKHFKNKEITKEQQSRIFIELNKHLNLLKKIVLYKENIDSKDLKKLPKINELIFNIINLFIPKFKYVLNPTSEKFNLKNEEKEAYEPFIVKTD